MPKKPEPSAREQVALPVEMIERRIYLVRGHKVMLDSDLAEIYGVPTFRLNEQVKRNRRRFPPDSMFQVSKKESEALTSQIEMSKRGRGGRRTLPYVFTEQGVAMLSSVLRSERAVLVNIAIMRAFVRLREMLATHKNLARQMADLERHQRKQDKQIEIIFSHIQKLLEPPKQPKRPIGFQPPRK